MFFRQKIIVKFFQILNIIPEQIVGFLVFLSRKISQRHFVVFNSVVFRVCQSEMQIDNVHGYLRAENFVREGVEALLFFRFFGRRPAGSREQAASCQRDGQREGQKQSCEPPDAVWNNFFEIHEKTPFLENNNRNRYDCFRVRH